MRMSFIYMWTKTDLCAAHRASRWKRGSGQLRIDLFLVRFYLTPVCYEPIVKLCLRRVVVEFLVPFLNQLVPSQSVFRDNLRKTSNILYNIRTTVAYHERGYLTNLRRGFHEKMPSFKYPRTCKYHGRIGILCECILCTFGMTVVPK